jgi:DNA-binding transcriptional LysR family regulator
MAIRVGRVGSENLVARHIGDTTLMLAAAPSYLARAGTPAVPKDLERHACLTYTYAANGNQAQFEGEDGESINIRIGGPVNANNGMLLAELAVAGSGIVFGPCFILQPLIERGQLVRLLADQGIRRLPIHVVYPTRRHLSAKVQAMTRFLGDWFASNTEKGAFR